MMQFYDKIEYNSNFQFKQVQLNLNFKIGTVYFIYIYVLMIQKLCLKNKRDPNKHEYKNSFMVETSKQLLTKYF